MDPTAGGQNIRHLLTDFHTTQSGDGETLPQRSGKASADRGRIQARY